MTDSTLENRAGSPHTELTDGISAKRDPPEQVFSESSSVPQSEEAERIQTKLSEATEKSGFHGNKILELGKVFSEQSIPADDVQQLSDAEVVDEAGRLANPEQLSIQELRHSFHVAERLDGLATKAKQQVERISEEKNRLMSKRSDLQQELSQQEQAKGLRRLASTFSRARISRQVDGMDASIKETEAIEKAYFDQAQSYEKKRSELTANQERVIIDTISNELQDIRDSYEDFLGSILDDGQLLCEIQDTFIAENLTPKLERLVENGQIKAEDRDNLLSQLRTTLAERAMSKERDANDSRGLSESYSGLDFDVKEDFDNLLQGYDRFIIGRIVAQLAYDDLAGLREKVVGFRGDYDWQRGIDAAFENVLRPARRGIEENSSLLGYIEPFTAETVSYRTMDMFEVVRNSNMVRGVFGEIINRIDNQIYSTIMDKALEDREGEYIDMLTYYPTPEAIRNLVIIAAADSQNYRTVHANMAFCSLARSKGWSDAVEQAAAKYPELKKVGNILKNWTHDEHWNHPEVKEVASDLALSLIGSDQETDPRLVQLAIEALPNEDVLSILVKDRVLSADIVLSVRNGVELLRRHSETLDESETRIAKQYDELSEADFRKRNFDTALFNFQDKVRKSALAIRKASENDEQARLPELISRFNRLGRVAEEWQKYSEDFDMLGYLSTNDFLDIAMGASDEGLSLLCKAPEFCPAIKTKAEIFLGFLNQYSEEFLNEEGLEFFQRISDAYSDYTDHKIQTFIGLVASEQLSRDRVEQLPKDTSDLLDDKHFSLVTQFPELYLSSNEGSDYYRKLSQAFSDKDLLREISVAVRNVHNPQQIFEILLRSPEYFLKLPVEYFSLLETNPELFPANITSETESQALLELFVKTRADIFLSKFSTKTRISTLFGAERAERFLKALPNETDEKRNAFTHNIYDRTSAFLIYLHSQSRNSDLNFLEDFDILSGYIEKYGLARSPLLLRYFKHISNLESNPGYQLPEDISQSQIRTLERLDLGVEKVNRLLFSKYEITAEQLKELNQFELELLKVATGKSTHRFDQGRPSFQTIVDDFIADSEAGLIVPLDNNNFRPIEFKIKDAVVKFDATEITSHFEVLSAEILDSLDKRGEFVDVQTELVQLIGNKQQEIIEVVKSTSNNHEGIQKQLEKLEESLKSAKAARTQDDLVRAILGTNFGKGEQSKSRELTRKLLLRKIFSVHYSPGFIEDLRIRMQASEISPAAILSIINVIDELGKQHAFRIENDDAMDYWSRDTLMWMRNNKKVQKALLGAFEPHAERLRAVVDEFKSMESGTEQKLVAVPDRGFTGEMSAYLADVCYSKEYPLLKTYPNVTPYKFLLPSPDGKSESLIGSVLIFEVQDRDGNDCLLVRGFNIPKETEMNIGVFIEQFLDHMQDIARKTGKRHVLIPGLQGAISNYMMTISHFNKYRDKDRKSSLNKRFDFNNYDLTNNVFIVRTNEDYISGNDSDI